MVDNLFTALVSSTNWSQLVFSVCAIKSFTKPFYVHTKKATRKPKLKFINEIVCFNVAAITSAHEKNMFIYCAWNGHWSLLPLEFRFIYVIWSYFYCSTERLLRSMMMTMTILSAQIVLGQSPCSHCIRFDSVCLSSSVFIVIVVVFSTPF